MKVAKAESHVKGSYGLEESKGFTIRTSAHAFRQLSSGMYKDKVAAPLRELGCNAMDAHIEFGTPDRPFEVKLPNRIDKQFYVRDWGPGLSHDDIMNMYTSYFMSTKQTSNDFTGAFGLGSKSPFSYTDAFVVTSVFGGKKRTYSAHLGDDGTPTIALLTTEDADKDWEHGLMVGFPVKPTDYTEFQEKAQQVFKWFRVPPKVEGAGAIVPIERAVDLPDFMRVKGGSGHGVLMGNVQYPLSRYNLTGLSPLGTKLFDFEGLVLKVGIGDVQVAISREELQYDKPTIAELLRRCEAAALHIAREAEGVARTFATAQWADKCKAAQMDSVWRDDSRYYRWDDLFTAAKMTDAAALALALRERSLPLPTVVGVKTSCRVIRPGDNGTVKHTVVHEGHTPKNKWGQRDPVKLSLTPSTKVYFGKAPHALARARQAVIDGTVKQLVLLVPDGKKGGDEKDVEREAKKLLSVFSGVEHDDIANLPIPPNHAQRTKYGKKKKLAGGALPPLASEMVIGRTHDDSPVQVDIAAPGMTYMVHRPRYSIRLLDTTVDNDRFWDLNTWAYMLSNLGRLRDELGEKPLPPYAFISVGKAKALDLQKRGMVRTYDAIKEWVGSQATRDAVAAVAGRWRQTISLSGVGGYSQTWTELLVNLCAKDRATYDLVKPELKFPGLTTAVEDIAAASVMAGNNAGLKSPAVLDLYARAAQQFDVPAIAGPVGKRTYLDLADLNAQLVQAYPLLGTFSWSSFVSLKTNNPNKLVEFMKFLHS